MALRRDEQYERGWAWQRRAACRGEHPASFFPPPHFERKDLRLARERVAKAICSACPVADSCLDHALETREPHGVWGGLNEVERRHLLESRIAHGEQAGAGGGAAGGGAAGGGIAGGGGR